MFGEQRPHGMTKLSSALDVGLLVVFLVFSTAGLIQLASPADCPQEPDPAAPAPLGSLEDAARFLQELIDRIDRLRDELDAAKARADALERRLDELRRSCPDVEALREKCNQARQQIERLLAEVSRLEQLLAELEKQKRRFDAATAELQRLQGCVTDLDRRLREIQAENARLAEEIAAFEAELLRRDNQTIRVESAPLAKAGTGRTPVYVALVGGTVAPVAPPFFSRETEMAERGNGRFEVVFHMKPKQSGEAADAALAPGSRFRDLIDAVNPDSQYVALLTDASSFETFRAVREALRQRGIPFGWEPWQQSTLTFTPAGQMILEQHDQ